MNEARNSKCLRQSRACQISARLQILQSRRLIQSSVQLLHRKSLADDDQFERLNRLRWETDQANQRYESTMLRLGSAEDNGYWLVAYGRLIASGSSLATKLRNRAADLPLEERFQAANDVAILERLIQRWTESKRRSMVEAVA